MASPPTALQGVEMDRQAVDDCLRNEGVGILALTDGDEAYGVPLSFGYDGDSRLYFLFLGLGETSKKEQLATQTEMASFTVTSVQSKHEWQSVIATGSVVSVPDTENDDLYAAIEDNAWYPSLFSESDPLTGVRGWALEIETVTGRSADGSKR